MRLSFLTRPIAVLLLACGPAAAQEAAVPQEATFEIELNTAGATDDGACRLTYLAVNRSDRPIDRAAYELAIFDADGAVTQLLSLDFGSLVAGKSKVLQFDLDGDCTAISRVLVNDVLACDVGGTPDSDLCLSGLTARSRTDIQFGI